MRIDSDHELAEILGQGEQWHTIYEQPLDGDVHTNIVQVVRLREDGLPYEGIVYRNKPSVIAIPITPTGEIIAAVQWRQGAECATLELPGGSITNGQDEKTEVLDELVKETGYKAIEGTLTYKGSILENPAQSKRGDHGVSVYIVHVDEIAGQEPEPDEYGFKPAAVLRLSIAELIDIISAGGIQSEDGSYLARLEGVTGLAIASHVISQLSRHHKPIEKQPKFVEFS
jgi:hypothetical protein